MKIYKIASYEFLKKEFLERFRPQSLSGLAAEALKFNSINEFEHSFLGEVRHGTYWHVTDDPNFVIDPDKGPRDMTSGAMYQVARKGDLMVTSDLSHWAKYYKDRKYVAEIDLSSLSPREYSQVKRGCGNEFYISDASKARVIRVLPLREALKIDEYRNKRLPSSSEKLMEFYNRVWQEYNEFIRQHDNFK